MVDQQGTLCTNVCPAKLLGEIKPENNLKQYVLNSSSSKSNAQTSTISMIVLLKKLSWLLPIITKK